jgi:hypothetical protein
LTLSGDRASPACLSRRLNEGVRAIVARRGLSASAMSGSRSREVRPRLRPRRGRSGRKVERRVVERECEGSKVGRIESEVKRGEGVVLIDGRRKAAAPRSEGALPKRAAPNPNERRRTLHRRTPCPVWRRQTKRGDAPENRAPLTVSQNTPL